MSEFITSGNIAFQIKKIITEARENIYIVVPALAMTRELYELLKDASERNINISFLYGNNELDPSEIATLAELKNFKLHCIPDINSRCYYNETVMLITSMNIYEFSDNNRFDMGVLIYRDSDRELYTKASNEISSMIEMAQKIMKDFEEELARLRESGQKPYVYQGFCIRCAMPITFNIEQPYCRACSVKSEPCSESEAGEFYCHSCGRKAEVTGRSPLCTECRGH